MSVFISYSRTDSEFVDLLQRLLVSKGYDAWLDRRNIDVGSRWDNAVEQAIQSRTYMIVVLSPESVASQNVSDEWNYALDEDKTIIPVYYHACTIPMSLRRVQWIDFEKQPFADAFKALTAALGESDNRPIDPIELAKREGLIFIEIQYPLELEKTRIAFVYSDYPFVQAFLSKVWFTLLWRSVERYTYGTAWVFRDKMTGNDYYPPEGIDTTKALLHEFGVEPGTHLEIILLKESN
jgi:hypothetical protein